MKTSISLADIVDCPKHRRSPYVITHVSQTQFSVSRYYGGCTYRSESYTYLPHTDELIRDDVLRWMQKKRQSKAKVETKSLL